jgi:lysophospholipase L1-like esterase
VRAHSNSFSKRGGKDMSRFFVKVLILCVFSVSPAFAITPYVMGVLGDSISAGFNAQKVGDNREFSWSGGQSPNHEVQSHAIRLQQVLPDRQVVVYNQAFVGAQSTNLERETSRLLKVKPDYVTLAIGANDVCNWPSEYENHLQKYQQNVESSISRIIRRNPKVKIVLASIPSIPLMWELGVKVPGCQQKWDAIQACKPLLDADLSDEQRQSFVMRYNHLNQTIESISEKYPQNVRYAGILKDIKFDVSMISQLDCFHPNIKGHQYISELSFDPTWF